MLQSSDCTTSNVAKLNFESLIVTLLKALKELQNCSYAAFIIVFIVRDN